MSLYNYIVIDTCTVKLHDTYWLAGVVSIHKEQEKNYLPQTLTDFVAHACIQYCCMHGSKSGSHIYITVDSEIPGLQTKFYPCPGPQ